MFNPRFPSIVIDSFEIPHKNKIAYHLWNAFFSKFHFGTFCASFEFLADFVERVDWGALTRVRKWAVTQGGAVAAVISYNFIIKSRIEYLSHRFELIISANIQATLKTVSRIQRSN